MNCIEAIASWSRNLPAKLALWEQNSGPVSFGALGTGAATVQQDLIQKGFKVGDCAILVALPRPPLYAAMTAVIGLGGRVMLVEPWLDATDVAAIIREQSPAFLLVDRVGWWWSRRFRALRSIKSVVVEGQVLRAASPKTLVVEACAPDDPAIVVFSSGSTGKPKGIVRSHKFSTDMVRLLTEDGRRDPYPEPDLAVLPGITILHLMSGRGAIMVGNDWRQRTLRSLGDRIGAYQPRTLSTNPAFLRALLTATKATTGFDSLRHIYVGGASPDRSLVQEALARWPMAKMTNIYGGSEAEPIAMADMVDALHFARERDEIQVRYIGSPFQFIDHASSDDGLWVSGPNVNGSYIKASAADARHKRTDAAGKRWHWTADRIDVQPEGWYFLGRTNQPVDEFALEQRLYRVLGHSRAFVTRAINGSLIALGEGVKAALPSIRAACPEIADGASIPVIFERRHRSRINRAASLRPHSMVRRWHQFFKERAPLPVLAFVAAGPSLGAALAASTATPSYLVVLHFAIIFLLLITVRLMDERKDLLKDLALEPARPLPRGLITKLEMRSAVDALLFALVALGFITGVTGGFYGGLAALLAVGYLLMMEREFYLGDVLKRWPLASALSHQALLVPMYLVPIATAVAAARLPSPVAVAFIVANFAGSMAYEIARKLDPRSPEGKDTYLQIYGRRRTLTMLLICAAVIIATHVMLGTWATIIPLSALFFVSLAAWFKAPAKFQAVEGSAALLSLGQLWMLFFV